MNKVRIITVILTVLAAAGEGVGAQDTPIAALSLPLNGMIVCQAIPDPEGMILEFTDVVMSFSKRETTLGFDASGNPLSIAVLAVGKSAEGRTVVDLVVVRFLPKAEGAVASVTGFDPDFDMPFRRPDDTVESLPPGWKKATANEVKQARTLALDFWKRRCGKDLIPPRGPTGPPTTD